MKQHLIKFLLLSYLFVCNSVFAAWVVSYTMTPSQPGYTAITGSGGTTTVSDFGFCPDQTISPLIPFGFNFTFDGTVYTNCVATDNGILIFGNHSALSNCGSNAGTSTDIPNNLADMNIPRPFLAPLWEELQFKPVSAFGSGCYKTVGVAGSRTFTMEWNRMSWRAPSNGDQISFQIILYEGTNIIDFNYFQGPTALGTLPTASIGLGAISPGTFYSLNNSTNTATASSASSTNTIAAKPATGQRFRWAPVGGLPIELLSFRGYANGAENVLEWKTASQQNNDYFILEHSADCMDFREIAREQGAGNCNTLMSYSKADRAPYEDITYYRLSWTDYNNNTEYSDVISIRGKKEDPPPILYPNPANDLIRFSEIQEKTPYVLMNLAGQLVASGELSKEHPQVDVSHVPEGMYMLVLNGKMFYKVVVERRAE